MTGMHQLNPDRIRLDFRENVFYLERKYLKEYQMAHKKVERRKELDRRRKRRAERLKLRSREARSGMTA